MLPAIAAIGGSVIGAAGNYASAQESARMSVKSAREQMAFQERMSNTAYQRAASDLEKAGLNRVIALGNPASTPSGAGYSMPDAKLGSAALEGASAVASVKNMQEQNKLIEAQARLTTAEASKAEVTKAIYDAALPLVNRLSEGFKSSAYDSKTPFIGNDSKSKVLDTLKRIGSGFGLGDDVGQLWELFKSNAAGRTGDMGTTLPKITVKP